MTPPAPWTDPRAGGRTTGGGAARGAAGAALPYSPDFWSVSDASSDSSAIPAPSSSICAASMMALTPKKTKEAMAM